MSEELAKREDFTPFLLFDRLDDELIKQELEGKLPEILTYHFTDKPTGKEIWGISKAGVDEAKGELGKKGEVIRELEVTFQDGENDAYFNVKAGRYVVSKEGKEILLDTAFGFKRQPKKYDSGKLNPFWYEQGAIKASRNASMRLIPKGIQQAVIEFAKKQGKVKTVEHEWTGTGTKTREYQEKPQRPDESNTEPSQFKTVSTQILDVIGKKDKKDGSIRYCIMALYQGNETSFYTPSRELAEEAKKEKGTAYPFVLKFVPTQDGNEIISLEKHQPEKTI